MRKITMLSCLFLMASCAENPFGSLEGDAAFNPPPDSSIRNRDSSVPSSDGANPVAVDCGDFKSINLPFDSTQLPGEGEYSLINGATIQNGQLAFSFPVGGFPIGDNRNSPSLDIRGLTLVNGGRIKARMSPVPDGSNSQMMLKVFHSPTQYTELVLLAQSGQLRTVSEGNAATPQNFNVANEWFSLFVTPDLVAAETSVDGSVWTRIAELPGNGAGPVRVLLQAFLYGLPAAQTNLFIDDVNVNCLDR